MKNINLGRRVFVGASTMLLSTALVSRAFAQTWPTGSVRVVEPGLPGGGNDTTIRLFTPYLEQAFGQPFVVDNRSGAGGRIGVENAFRSPSDGSTLLLGNAGSNGINAALYRNLPYDLETNFTPISLLVTGPNALVVNPQIFPVNDVAELIAAIKAKPPGFYNYGSGGVGSSAHLSSELFKQMTGLQIEHIPYRGAAQFNQAAIAGDAPIVIANLVNVMPFVASGQLKLLAVTSLNRWPDVPNTPTLNESGLPGFETMAWNALFGPPGMQRSIVDRLVPELQRIGRLPEVVKRVKLLGGEVVTSTPEVLAQRVRSDIAKWRDLVQHAKIPLQ